jgi:4-methylaminobutanoate oxidase (formaldehyde-forming)
MLAATDGPLHLRHPIAYAINSLRLERGYRVRGAELSPDDTPLEAGDSFAIAWDTDLIGRDALAVQREHGVQKRMVSFAPEDPEPMLWGSEPILRNGETVGYTTSGAYGHTLGGAVAMGYVPHEGGIDAAFVKAGRHEIGIAAERFAASAHLRSPYDPARERILR